MISMKASENSSEQFSLSFAKNLNSPTKMKLKLSLSWISKTKISQWMEDCVVEYEVARSQIMSIYHLISYTCYTQRISVAHIFIFYSFFSPSLLSLCNGKKKAKLEKLFTNGCLTAHSTSRRRVKQTRLSEALKVYFRKKKTKSKEDGEKEKNVSCRVSVKKMWNFFNNLFKCAHDKLHLNHSVELCKRNE